ncbi:T9SS C-terminal target domain-containing protein [Paludibacter sp. 221]|uniref:DUF6383 domain-containing protein n=1 Tax=Paludibacter sp. 221 TaxID=2302939 RepID=UPI0013D5AD36|nr:DUF6383 domain-containing protein [Paludibacter sp. 221]NDV46811.1 T9SS C-terminal target domain-containing protein [Paludibacter sp. 221]
MNTLHIDVWTPNAVKFEISPIGGGETLVACAPLNQEQWNSFDIPLSSFTGVNPAAIYQMKLVADDDEVNDNPSKAIVYVDNIYFYQNTTTGVAEQGVAGANWYVDAETIYIQAAGAKSVKIYDMLGKSVYTNLSADNAIAVKLSKGIYLMDIDGEALKVFVK